VCSRVIWTLIRLGNGERLWGTERRYGAGGETSYQGVKR
jgi:hypothetical protein